mgnify:FL=1
MVANVLEVSVSVGEQISVGQTLLLLESMKMEIPVIAEVNGKVIEVAVTPGEVIQEGDPLIMIESANFGSANIGSVSKT